MTTKENTADREIKISRLLDAPVDLVWEVWTDPEHIRNWWGPNGFTNSISKMEMQAGGDWDLVMHGPDGTDYKNKSKFKEVVHHHKIVYEHITGPKFTATITFEAKGEKTQLEWQMLFATRAELIEVVKTFKADEGLRQNAEKLESYIKAQFQLRLETYPEAEASFASGFKKTNNMARTCSYLNFPGTTEEAFLFYKKIFKSEFSGKGIQRLGEVPPSHEHPPLSEADKKLILHIELPITGGHVLMATDAPESMGFTLTTGNTMHISIEPESREETTRLFNELSAGGKVDMPLQDMFFGAYFGSFTDKYGINWMVNFAQK